MEGVSSVTATNSVEIGARKTVAGEDYVYCYNNTGSSVTQGAAMTISGAVSGYSLTRSTVSGADVVICFVKHATVPAANYFWGLTRGLVNPTNVSAICAGVLIGVGDDGVVKTYATSTSFDMGVLGKMIVSSVSSTGGGVAYVKCFG